MKELEDRIRKEGKVLSGDVLKVDSFLNHQVDVALLDDLGKFFYENFKDRPINKILTLESSGIAVAVCAARWFKVPVVFAKKCASRNIGDAVYHESVHSYTRGKDYQIEVSADYLNENDHVLIIDDFLATGSAQKGLIQLCKQAGAKVEGIGIAIEKGYQSGGKWLRYEGYKVVCGAIVANMEPGHIEFRDNPADALDFTRSEQA